MKKITRKILMTIAVVVMAMVCFAFSASALEETGQCGDNVYWEFDSTTGELIISGEGDMWDWFVSHDELSPFYASDIINVVVEDGVTSIGEYTFLYCRSLISAKIPDSVTDIGNGAFYCCENITAVDIPDSITNISDYIFYDCESLASILLPNDVTYIGDSAFYDCKSIKNIEIPEKVEAIGNSAFGGCESLLAVTIPDSVKTAIKAGTFERCSSLESVKIGNSVTDIGEQAFYNCYSLESIEIPDSVTSIGESAFECSALKSITIGSGLQSIGYSAFAWSGLENIIIPDSVTSIEMGAFECSALKSITIGRGVTSIEYSTFAWCSNLESVVIPDTVTYIDGRAFYDCDSLKNIIIPDSVTTIEFDAFAGAAIESIKLPESVERINPTAFNDCSDLVEFIVDEKNSYFSNDEYGVLFNKEKTQLIKYPGGKKIKEYIVPDTVYVIGSYAFSNTFLGLERVTIPESVSDIGEFAFTYCRRLEKITVDENNNYYSCDPEGALYNKEKTVLIHHPSYLKRDFVIPETVRTVLHGAFYECQIKHLIIHKDIKFEGYEPVFDGYIEKLTFLEGLEEINDYVFEGCRIETVILPISLKKVGNGAFNLNHIDDTDVYYPGTKEQFEEIEDFGSYFTPRIHFLTTDDVNHYQKAETVLFCTRWGYTEYRCPCGYSYTIEEAPIGHEYIPTVTHQPTCTENGVTEYKCRCEASYWEFIPATGHNFNDDGVCKNCGEEKEKTFLERIKDFFNKIIEWFKNLFKF